MPRHIDDFADEIETGHASGFHRFGGEFIRVDAADGDFGLGKTLGTGWFQIPRANRCVGIQLVPTQASILCRCHVLCPHRRLTRRETNLRKRLEMV